MISVQNLCLIIILFENIKVLQNNTVLESLPSETIVAWTDPTIQAIAEPPKITPNVIHEGDDFQVHNQSLFNY